MIERELKHAPVAPPVKPRRRHRWLAVACWGYLALVAAAWVFLRTWADRWWPATLLLFGPRWLLAAPAVLLVPLVALLRRRTLPVILTATVIALVPVSGFCIPALSRRPDGPVRLSVRILTCNTHHRTLDMDALRRLIAETHPDMLALQEWSSGARPDIFGADLTYVHLDGEYCFVSRWPLRRLGDPLWKREPEGIKPYEIQTPAGTIYAASIHLASPHQAFIDAMHRRAGWVAHVEANRASRERGAQDLRQLAAELPGPVLFAGDFNLPVDSAIYRDNLSALTDAWSAVNFGFGMTYHAKWTLTRIDHVLADSHWRVANCFVGPNLGSPHRPVIADLEWVREE